MISELSTSVHAWQTDCVWNCRRHERQDLG